MPNTSHFDQMPDYKDAYTNNGLIYFGSFEKPPLSDYLDDIDKNGAQSQYHPHVFYPGKRYDKNEIASSIRHLEVRPRSW
jgi:hypothetical protein